MKKRESVQFFTRFLLLTVLSVVNIVICFSIVDNGTFFEILAGFLVIANVFVLLYMVVKSIRIFIRHVFDKKKKRFEFLYLVNIIFSIFVTGLYLFFYFFIIMGVFIVLLPFIA